MSDSWCVPTRPGRGGLGELARVGWSSLAHAYTGSEYNFSRDLVPCDDLPKVLISFHGEDAEERAEAYLAVLSVAWHQGSIYEVTAAVVPFLAAFSADPKTPNRGRILAAIVLIASSVVDEQPGNRIAAQVKRALVASRAWLECSAEQGPELATRATALIRAALDEPGEGTAQALGELAGELESWGEAEGAEPEPSDEEARRELEALASALPNADHDLRTRGLFRAEHLLRRAPATALKVAEAFDDTELDGWRRLVRLEALWLNQRHDEALAELRDFVEEWLRPARLGALNQKVTRNQLLRGLDLFAPAAVEEERRRVEQSCEPEVVPPDGDTL